MSNPRTTYHVQIRGSVSYIVTPSRDPARRKRWKLFTPGCPRGDYFDNLAGIKRWLRAIHGPGTAIRLVPMADVPADEPDPLNLERVKTVEYRIKKGRKL